MPDHEVVMTNAGRALEILEQRREDAVAAGQVFYPAVIKKQVKGIQKIIRRDLFFSKNETDLVDLLDFCGNSEFRGHKILGKVLLYTMKTLGRILPVGDAHHEICWLVTYSPENVNHYLSTCNVDRLTVGHLRIPDLLIEWMTNYVYRMFDVSFTHHRFLSIVNADSLRELLRRTAWSSDSKRDSKNRKAREDVQSKRINIFTDLLYLNLVALYCQLVDRSTHKSQNEIDTKKILGCLNIIYGAFPTVHVKMIYERAVRLHFMWNTKKMLDKVFRWIRKNGTLNLMEQLNGEVPSLKKLSRNQIRSCLYLNWSLPEGLRELKLPQTLENYMDLQYD